MSLVLSLFALVPGQVSAPSVVSVWKETLLNSVISSGHQVDCLCQISCRPAVVLSNAPLTRWLLRTGTLLPQRKPHKIVHLEAHLCFSPTLRHCPPKVWDCEGQPRPLQVLIDYRTPAVLTLHSKCVQCTQRQLQNCSIN